VSVIQRFQQALTRREMLGIMGAAGVIAVVGCEDDEGPATTQTATGTATSSPATGTTPTATGGTPAAVSCVLTPQQTEGPYFVDEKLNRADIRSDPGSGAVKEGVVLRLNLAVYRVDGAACTPLAGAIVDVWHCDALGVYSDVSGAGQSNTAGQKFLRGYQVTDANGRVQFQTIYPGWYQGRTVHIHFKVRTDQGLEFTSQLYFDEALSAQVFAQAPYNTKGPSGTPNASDGIFSNETVLTITPEGSGYVGTFNVGLQMA